MIKSSSGLPRKMKSASQVRGENGLRSAVEIETTFGIKNPSYNAIWLEKAKLDDELILFQNLFSDEKVVNITEKLNDSWNLHLGNPKNTKEKHDK